MNYKKWKPNIQTFLINNTKILPFPQNKNFNKKNEEYIIEFKFNCSVIYDMNLIISI